MSENTRIQILRYLKDNQKGTATELSEVLMNKDSNKMTRANVQHHLKALEKKGYIFREKGMLSPEL